MRIDEFIKIIEEKEQCHDEWTYGIEQCWKKGIEILSEDIPSTIKFLNAECTAEEYSWISEVIDDVVEKVPSRELVNCYKNLMSKFPQRVSKIQYCRTY